MSKNRIRRFDEGFPPSISDSLIPYLTAGGGSHVAVLVSSELETLRTGQFIAIEWLGTDDVFNRVCYSLVLGVVLEWESTPQGER